MSAFYSFLSGEITYVYRVVVFNRGIIESESEYLFYSYESMLKYIQGLVRLYGHSGIELSYVSSGNRMQFRQIDNRTSLFEVLYSSDSLATPSCGRFDIGFFLSKLIV